MNSVASLAAFFSTLERFQALEPGLVGERDLVALAERCQLWSFQAGDVVAFPDEKPEGWLVVAEGCLVLQKAGQPDFYLGVRETLDPQKDGLWRGQTTGSYVVVPQEAWSRWLRERPAVALKFGEDPGLKLPPSLDKTPILLQEGEVLKHLFRKSPLFLVRRALVPGVLLVVLAVFSVLIPFPLGIFPLAGALMCAVLVTLFAWEWSVSVLAVTDRAVILRQIDAWERRSDFEKLALEKIREATYRKQGLFDSLFGLVNLELEGDSPKGRLVFEGLVAGNVFVSAMEDLRVQRSRQNPDRRTIRQALGVRAGAARKPVLVLAPRKVELLRSQKPRRLSWRLESEGTVSFRRHPWHLIKKFLPWLGWTALLVFLGVLASVLVPKAASGAFWATLAAVLVPSARLIYEFLDWSNDRLLLQGEKIIALHRKPFWLGERRQEGDIAQIQQTGVRKDSLAGLILDFGTVTVSLGASDPLVFENASHPEWVQNEIFQYRSRVQAEKEHQAAADRLDEVSEILDTWDEAKKAGYFSS